jgi:hypothetical protein
MVGPDPARRPFPWGMAGPSGVPDPRARARVPASCRHSVNLTLTTRLSGGLPAWRLARRAGLTSVSEFH